tara:strand:+ start:620 stop:1087 length:468 start_codon:yes stop_codon:yes gene_type:complete
MSSIYINIYNNLVTLTRNKALYQKFKIQDTFSDRLVFLLLHFAFFIKRFKNDKNKEILQDIYDYFFRQLELSIREIGYGDQTINKKMKVYLNLFHSMLDDMHNWDISTKKIKTNILATFIDESKNTTFFVDYFDKFNEDLLKNTLNFYIKGVIKT